jgi:hypothetical protein
MCKILKIDVRATKLYIKILQNQTGFDFLPNFIKPKIDISCKYI